MVAVRTSSRWTLRAVLAAALTVSAPLFGQSRRDATSSAERASARASMVRGDAAYADGRLAEALEAYRAADRVMRVPTTAYAVGRVEVTLGHLVEADDALLRAVRYPVADAEPEAFSEARAAAASLVRELEPRLPEVEIAVSPSTARSEVTVDGAAVLVAGSVAVLRLDPGAHVLRVAAPGYGSAEQRFSVADFDRKRISVELPRILRLADVPTATWVAAGTAGVAALAGVIAGALSAADASDVLARCTGAVCDPSVKPQYDRAYDLASVSNTAFLAAGSGAVAALVSLSALPTFEHKEVRVHVSANGVLVSGCF